MTDNIDSERKLGWYPLNADSGPAISYRLERTVLYDIIKALLATMPISDEKEQRSRDYVLSVISGVGESNIRISRSNKGYTVNIARGADIIAFGKTPSNLYDALFTIKDESGKYRFISSIIIIYPEGEKRQQAWIYRDLNSMNPSQDRGLQITDKKDTKVYIFSPNQPNIILNKIPLDGKGEYHGVEERFFFTLNDKPANYRYWLHNKEVTLDTYARYIVKELQENTSLISDLVAIAGEYAVSSTR